MRKEEALFVDTEYDFLRILGPNMFKNKTKQRFGYYLDENYIEILIQDAKSEKFGNHLQLAPPKK